MKTLTTLAAGLCLLALTAAVLPSLFFPAACVVGFAVYQSTAD